MKDKKFDRRFVADGSRRTIWQRVAGGNWAIWLDFDDRRENLGPYAS